MAALSVQFRKTTIVVDIATLSMVERQHRRKLLADVFEPDEYDRMAATAWVILRRHDQSVSWEDFQAEMTTGAFDAMTPVEEPDDPEA